MTVEGHPTAAAAFVQRCSLHTTGANSGNLMSWAGKVVVNGQARAPWCDRETCITYVSNASHERRALQSKTHSHRGKWLRPNTELLLGHYSQTSMFGIGIRENPKRTIGLDRWNLQLLLECAPGHGSRSWQPFGRVTNGETEGAAEIVRDGCAPWSRKSRRRDRPFISSERRCPHARIGCSRQVCQRL